MVKLWGSEFTRTELSKRVGRFEQIAGVRLVTLGDGNERGVRVLEFRTGSGFVFEVLVDRAFDIGRCEYQGMPLGWESPVGYGGPWFGDYVDLGFLRKWGGGFADHWWTRSRVVHGGRHRQAVPLSAEANRDVRFARPRSNRPAN